MNPTPILQRTIAFALSGSELGTDLLEWHYLDSYGFDNAHGFSTPVSDNAEGSRLRQ